MAFFSVANGGTEIDVDYRLTKNLTADILQEIIWIINWLQIQL